MCMRKIYSSLGLFLAVITVMISLSRGSYASTECQDENISYQSLALSESPSSENSCNDPSDCTENCNVFCCKLIFTQMKLSIAVNSFIYKINFSNNLLHESTSLSSLERPPRA